MKRALKRCRVSLREIDLSRAREHEHPDIKPDRNYLAQIGGEFHAGQFSREWYGWNFEGWSHNPAGLQFDAPGWNASDWERLWEIRES